MWFYFTHKDMPYSLREGPTFGLPKTHSFHFTIVQMQLILVVLIWNNLLDVVKSSNSLFDFKNKNKCAGNIDCGCLI